MLAAGRLTAALPLIGAGQYVQPAPLLVRVAAPIVDLRSEIAGHRGMMSGVRAPNVNPAGRSLLHP